MCQLLRYIHIRAFSSSTIYSICISSFFSIFDKRMRLLNVLKTCVFLSTYSVVFQRKYCKLQGNPLGLGTHMFCRMIYKMYNIVSIQLHKRICYRIHIIVRCRMRHIAYKLYVACRKLKLMRANIPLNCF